MDDDDEVGSLVDFVVEDEEEVPSAKPAADPLDGMDMANVLLGKRKRKQTVFYEQEVFASAEYRKMVLEDIPPEELHAAIGEEEEDEGEEEEEEDDDDDYDEEAGESDDEEADESDEEEADESDEEKADEGDKKKGGE